MPFVEGIDMLQVDINEMELSLKEFEPWKYYYRARKKELEILFSIFDFKKTGKILQN